MSWRRSGNHEEHAQPSADQGEHEDAGVLEIEAEKDERGQGEDDAGGDGLAGIAGGLDDVVLEDGGAAEDAQDADGEHRDGNGGGDRESGAQAHVDRDRAEDDAEDRAQQHGAEGEFRTGIAVRDKGPKAVRNICHANASTQIQETRVRLKCYRCFAPMRCGGARVFSGRTSLTAQAQ